jgi:O-succinylbenzoic acid--CoA ligase
MPKTRELIAVSPDNPALVRQRLEEALNGEVAVIVTKGGAPAGSVPTEIAVVIETSGSTGKPKLAMLTKSALLAGARATESTIGSGSWVRALPLNYVAGLMVYVRAIVAGTEVADFAGDRFDAADFARFVNELPTGVWFTALVPTQLERIVEHAEKNEQAREAFQRLSKILIGGQATPQGLLERSHTLGLPVVRTYGSAETSGGVVYDGVAIGETRLRITAEGLVEISGPSLATGYLGDPELTAKNFVTDQAGNSWWRTNDLGVISDGSLQIIGRADDVIISGGMKVSLTEIEKVLAEAGITAVASWFEDETWGQVPALLSLAELDQQAVRNEIEHRLGKAARPYRFLLVPDFPRLPSGKLDRLTAHRLITETPT